LAIIFSLSLSSSSSCDSSCFSRCNAFLAAASFAVSLYHLIEIVLLLKAAEWSGLAAGSSVGVAAFLPSQTKIGPPPAEMTCNPRNTVPFFHHSFQRTKRSEFAVKADAAAAACLNDPCAGSRPNGANDRLKRSPSVAPPATFSPSAQITTVVFCRVASKLSRVRAEAG